MPKENRVGDGSGIKDASLTSHSSPECDSPHHVKGPGPPPQLPLQAIIKTEMDIDSVSCCGPSPCGSHHGHDNMMVGQTDSPSMCYSSSPSYSLHHDVSPCVPPYSRIHVSCSSHSPTTSNSMSPHPPPSPHHPSTPLHLHSMPPKGGAVPGVNIPNMPSPLYVGGGDKDSSHAPPPHPHKYSSYGHAEHHLPHPPPHHHPHIRALPSSESCNFSGIMVRTRQHITQKSN